MKVKVSLAARLNQFYLELKVLFLKWIKESGKPPSARIFGATVPLGKGKMRHSLLSAENLDHIPGIFREVADVIRHTSLKKMSVHYSSGYPDIDWMLKAIEGTFPEIRLFPESPEKKEPFLRAKVLFKFSFFKFLCSVGVRALRSLFPRS